jgi:general secretion pathway protein M
MKDWFDALESREQGFVIVGAAAIVIAICYALVWLPLDKSQRTMAENVATWERSLAELRPLKGLAPTTAGNQRSPGAMSQQAPVVIVDQSLRARALDSALKRSQPTTSNGIRVEFEDVAFDDLVLWLGDLSNQYGMQVTSGSFSTTGRAGPGRVNATLTLERAP